MTTTPFTSEETLTETEITADPGSCSVTDLDEAAATDGDDDGEDDATTAPAALIGPALLAKLKEMGDVNKSDLVRACGYISTKKDGTERLNFTAFYEAVLNAKGMDIGSSARGKAGPKLSYKATVQGNGNLLVGKAYTALLDLKPGDEFEIKLGRRQIRLVPVGSQDED